MPRLMDIVKSLVAARALAPNRQRRGHERWPIMEQLESRIVLSTVVHDPSYDGTGTPQPLSGDTQYSITGQLLAPNSVHDLNLYSFVASKGNTLSFSAEDKLDVPGVFFLIQTAPSSDGSSTYLYDSAFQTATISGQVTLPTSGSYWLRISTVLYGPVNYSINISGITSASATPTSLNWNDVDGGVDFAYTLDGTLSSDVPVDFYWSPTQTFNTSQDTLADSATIPNGQSSPSTIHIAASSLTAPPAGTEDLLAVVDPEGSAASVPLAYDPTLTITSKYNGNAGGNVFGRFLAAPGAITDETLTVQLSNSLAALRPIVTTLVDDDSVSTSSGEESVLSTHHVIGSSGNWDGLTYQTDPFDPGSLAGPTTLTTQALANDETNLAQITDVLDVEPLPDWITQLMNNSITFYATAVGAANIQSDTYTIKGVLADLSLSPKAVIPSHVPLIGGESVGAAAELGVIATVPLAITSSPTVSGYGGFTIHVGSSNLFDKTYGAYFNLLSDDTGSFSATPDFTLNSDSLQPTGGFGMDFKFTGKVPLSNIPLYNGHIVFRGISIPLQLSASESFDLSEEANITLTPESGFSINPGQASIILGLTNTLAGDVGYDVSIPKRKPVVTLKIKARALGSLNLHSNVSYSGSADSIAPVLVSFVGVFDPRLDGQFVFTYKGHKPIDKPSGNLLDIFFDDLPRRFSLYNNK
jgi:hypothetical protein